MIYVYVENNTAVNFFAEYDPKFPGVPITDRYSPEFLSSCVTVSEHDDIGPGYLWDGDAGKFIPPPVVPASEEE